MSNSSYNPTDFTDHRNEQSTLSVGADSLQTQDRESRIDTGTRFTDDRDDETPTVSAQADITGTVQWPSRAKHWLSTTDSSGEGIYLRLRKTNDDAKRPYRLVFEDKDDDESLSVGEALTKTAGETVLDRIERELRPTDFPSIHDEEAQTTVRNLILDVNQENSDTDGFAVFATNTYDPTAFDFDDYGPTNDRPIPESEVASLPGGVDQREIPDSGLSASDLTDWPFINEERSEREESRVEFDDAMTIIDDPTSDDSTADAEETVQDGREISFERLDAANDWRDEHPDALGPSDTRRTKTVTLRADVDDATEDSAGDAAFSSQHTGKSYGQMQLSDAERARLDDKSDWTWGTKGFHAMAAKAVLVEEGADNWLDHYQPDLEPIEHASVVETGKEDAARLGLSGPGETGEIDDSDPDMHDPARQHSKGLGEACEHARDHCEDGDDGACEHLQADCGYSEGDVEQLRDAFEQVGEDPDVVLDASAYDPTGDEPEPPEDDVLDEAFAEWAAQMEPDAERPSDDDLAKLAPIPSDDPTEMHQQLPGPALLALRKAWGGYRAARAEERSAVGKAEQYAEIINGVRAVNGQDPLSFEKLDGWAGGEPLPDDPTETFPGPDGQETIEEASTKDRISRAVQSSFSAFRNVYDPTATG